MAHYAKVDNGIVTNVIVADQHFIDSGAVGDPASWIQTSYNTLGGTHLLGGIPLRKNFAAVGYSYDPVRDIFIPPKPFKSWVLNEDAGIWESPIPMPADGKIYIWDDDINNWKIKG